MYYFEPFKLPRELSEIEEQDVLILVEYIRNLDKFDSIIIDIQFNINSIFCSIVKQSNRIIFVSDSSNMSNYKIQKAIDSISDLDIQDYKEKINIVYNKYISGKGEIIKENSYESIYLPKYSDVGYKDIVDEISSLSTLLKLYEKVI